MFFSQVASKGLMKSEINMLISSLCVDVIFKSVAFSSMADGKCWEPQCSVFDEKGGDSCTLAHCVYWQKQLDRGEKNILKKKRGIILCVGSHQWSFCENVCHEFYILCVSHSAVLIHLPSQACIHSRYSCHRIITQMITFSSNSALLL